jgi:hypothetical protein
MLALADTPITDDGVRILMKLKGLERLNAAGTQITDEGLALLETLPDLEWACVSRTKVTSIGVARLGAIRPQLSVIVDSEP